MTDPTAPVTPRTEAGRALRDRLLSMFRAWEQMAAQAMIHVPTIEDPAGFILAIEREAGSPETRTEAACPVCFHDVDHDAPCPSGCPQCGRQAGSTDALRAALLLLHEWREASLNDDAGALGTLTDATTDFIDGAALAASDAGPAGIDVETLTAALVDAEDDDQMGPEYRPERLAEYLHDWLDRLSRESDR
jgi:hypothetical protein